VLNFDQLHRDLGFSQAEFDQLKQSGTRGTSLDEKRKEVAAARHRKTMEEVQRIGELHYRTLAYLTCLSNGTRTAEVKKFLLEQNGISSDGPAFAIARTNDGGTTDYKRARPATSPVVLQTGRFDLVANILDLEMVEPRDDESIPNYYEMLGIPNDASVVAVSCALRLFEANSARLSPEDENLTYLREQLEEARTTLLDSRKRSRYDCLLAAPQQTGDFPFVDTPSHPE